MSKFKRQVEGAFRRADEKSEAHQLAHALESEEYWEEANLGSSHLPDMSDRIAADELQTPQSGDETKD